MTIMNDDKYTEMVKEQMKYSGNQLSKLAKGETHRIVCKNTQVPKRFYNSTFDNFENMSENIRVLKDVNYSFNKPIFLYGNVGAGKTHIAVSILLNVIKKRLTELNERVIEECKNFLDNKIDSVSCIDERGHPLTQGEQFIPAIDLLLDIKSTFGKDCPNEMDTIRKYNFYKWLIVDDLGSEKATDYVLQSWYSIIDHRYSNCKPTIYTSNLTPKEIAERYGDRIASRLISGLSIKLDGEDYRLKR